MVITKEVKVSCKRCGKQVPVSDLSLDAIYRMMVCSVCVKERKDKARVQQELKSQQQDKATAVAAQKLKPAGWDAEDEYIEKKFKEKMTNAPAAERMDATHVKFRCSKCGYRFTYNEETKTPSSCPYCGREVHTLQF